MIQIIKSHWSTDKKNRDKKKEKKKKKRRTKIKIKHKHVHKTWKYIIIKRWGKWKKKTNNQNVIISMLENDQNLWGTG